MKIRGYDGCAHHAGIGVGGRVRRACRGDGKDGCRLTMVKDKGRRKDGGEDVRPQYDDPGTKAKQRKSQIVKREEAARVVPFLSHLPQYEAHSGAVAGLQSQDVHRAITKLGAQYATGYIQGASARTVALVEACIEVVKDFTLQHGSSSRAAARGVGDATPSAMLLSVTSSSPAVARDMVMNAENPSHELETMDVRRELDKRIKQCVQFVIDCRAMALPMGNFVRHLRALISAMSPDISEHEAKERLVASMQDYLNAKLLLPQRTIIQTGADRAVEEDDVIMVIGRGGYLVEQVLCTAARTKSFRVVVIESRPHAGGLFLAEQLSERDVPVEYGLMNAVSYLLPAVTKILVGAHGIMSNGAVLSRIGTAAIAALAKTQHIPFIVLSESIKFADRVQLDALCYNELGNAEELLLPKNMQNPEFHLTEGWSEAKDTANLRMLNLMYDLTPIDLIDAVITDSGVIPASSVTVLVNDQIIM
ncbi:Translation initiation factor eIF-2B subunit delta [Porphyridium purpureum]|uniref:Translation initiation factor eIF2B subunit delta n=1 Tax=Porphyridium purpureum TaxID=35688 RepID=A0A5J4Z4U4_PORPP|nr:Translation initiation factor eIF-2B subunit delta [Porphyridium purpureum]|eukprot:POR1655..scf295_1